MQYQFTERLEYIKTIEFFNTNPLHIERIRYFQEEGVIGTIVSREFSYSWDKSVWSNWNTLSLANLTNISFRDRLNFYLKIRYTRAGIGSGNILRWYLIYDKIGPTPPGPVPDTSINAWWFRGEGPEYFLNRENHIGPYTDLNVYNVDDGSTAGVYSHRIDSSIGTNFYFKRIKGEGGLEVADGSNGIITISTDPSGASSGVYNTTLDPCLFMVTGLGGIPSGTSVADLKGDTFTSLWDSLLFPTVNPTYNPPFGTFGSIPSTTLYEVSANISSLQFNTSFNRGQILIGSTEQNKRSGLPNNYNFTGFGLIDVSSALLSNSQTLSNYKVVLGNQSWLAVISFDEGPQPLDSKGNPYQSPLPPNSLTASSQIIIEGSYPYFATSVNLTTFTSQPLTPLNNNPAPTSAGMTLVSEDGVNKQKFKIPVARLNLHALTGIKNFNPLATPPNDWYYEQGNQSASLAMWTVTDSSENIQGYSTPYKLYTYNGVNRGEMKIRLEF